MRILIVGAGATGGYFGGRLAEAGRDVTFLVRFARAKRLRADGLRIVSPHGDLTLSPKLVTAGGIDGPFDVVLLTVKAYALDAALRDLGPAVGPETMILPVLNGMRHVDALRERFGAQTVVGCVCKVVSTLDEEGRIIQSLPLQELNYGELDGARSPRIERLDAALRDAGFDARLSSEILQEMWEKWVLVSSVGGATCLMRGALDEIAAAPGGADFLLAFLAEIGAVAAAAGHAPRADFLEQMQVLLTKQGAIKASSMYRDLTQGFPVEGEQIIGDLVIRARDAGVAVPLVAAARTHLSVYQNRLDAD